MDFSRIPQIKVLVQAKIRDIYVPSKVRFTEILDESTKMGENWKFLQYNNPNVRYETPPLLRAFVLQARTADRSLLDRKKANVNKLL
jgi:hypothetical protein